MDLSGQEDNGSIRSIFASEQQSGRSEDHRYRNKLTHAVEHPGEVVRGYHKQENADPVARRILPEHQCNTKHLKCGNYQKKYPIIFHTQRFDPRHQNQKSRILRIGIQYTEQVREACRCAAKL